MPIGPYDSSSLSDFIAQSGTNSQTRRQTTIDTDSLNRFSNNHNNTPVDLQNTQNAQNTRNNITRPPIASATENNFTSAAIPGLTSNQLLNQAVVRVSDIVQQQTQEQLTAGYQHPGTYLSILV